MNPPSLSPRRAAFTLTELLVVVSIIGLLVGLTLPAIQGARESARKAQCGNNLRQIAMGVLRFQSQKGGKLPTSVNPGVSGSPGLASLTQILPFIDKQVMFNKYDTTKNWYEGPNVVVSGTRVEIYQCPSSPEGTRLDGQADKVPWDAGPAAPTDYSAVTGVDQRLHGANMVDAYGPGFLAKNTPARIEHVLDGMSTTILLAESAGRPALYQRGGKIGEVPSQRVNGGGWARPETDFALDGASQNGSTLPGDFGINATNGEDVGSSSFPHPYYGTEGSGEIYSFHPGGAHVALGDGSVRLLSDSIRIRELAKLVTRQGDELVSLADEK